MTGTGIIPPAEFTLEAGDEVRIIVNGIGTLTNSVIRLPISPRWRARGQMRGKQPLAIQFEWRGAFGNAEVITLHATAFGYTAGSEEVDVWARVNRHSLGWVCARDEPWLVGFVNVAWDGATHAFLLDTIVARDVRRHGIGRELVRRATTGAREAGCDWLHVDFEPHLMTFYVEACGFRPTDAGLIDLAG